MCSQPSFLEENQGFPSLPGGVSWAGGPPSMAEGGSLAAGNDHSLRPIIRVALQGRSWEVGQ